MFGISFSEIILIFIIALLVLEPKQLPQIINKAAMLVMTLRNFITRLRKDIYLQSGFDELNNTKNLLINKYQQIKNNMLLNESLRFMHPPRLDINEFHQPELEFDKEPELF